MGPLQWPVGAEGTCPPLAEIPFSGWGYSGPSGERISFILDKIGGIGYPTQGFFKCSANTFAGFPVGVLNRD
jgi:hypothetical protein